MMFQNRQDAGKQLADKLSKYKDDKNVIIIGLPRGGVVTAAVVAKELGAHLDIIVPRKIGYPGNPEFAIGAITEDGEAVMNEETITARGIPQDYIDQTVATEKQEAQRRLKVYRGERPPLDLKGKTAILVDDGIATGATMRAAIVSARAKGANKVVVAVPVTAQDAEAIIEEECDEFICIDSPASFGAVGAFYSEFLPTADEEVIGILQTTA